MKCETAGGERERVRIVAETTLELSSIGQGHELRELNLKSEERFFLPSISILSSLLSTYTY